MADLLFFFFFPLPTFLFASTFLDADSIDCEALLCQHLLWRGAPWHIILSRHLRYHCVIVVCSDCNHQAIAIAISVLFGPRTSFMDVEIQIG